MPTVTLRSLAGTRETKVGTFLFEFATPGIGQILKAAGADFAVLDMEHTGFGFDTVRQVVRYCQAAGLPVVVRVPSQQRHHISRALDTGADGVMVPIVSSVEQAKAVLEAAKYWPDGTRGVALGLAPLFADRERAGLLCRPFAMSHPTGGYWLVHRAQEAGNPALRAFKRWMRGELSRNG